MNLIRLTHAVAMLSHGLLLVGLLWWTHFSPLGVVSAAILLVPMRGIVRGNTYTCGWASMLLTFYCALLLADAYADTQDQAASFSLAALAALDFVSLVLFVRLRSRQRAAGESAAAAASPVARTAE